MATKLMLRLFSVLVLLLAFSDPARAVLIADDASFQTPLNTSVNSDLSLLVTGAVDPDFTITGAPSHGIVVLQILTGAFTYTPTLGFTGPDSFVYGASEHSAPSTILDTGTISFTVCPGACPTAVPEPASALLLFSGIAALGLKVSRLRN